MQGNGKLHRQIEKLNNKVAFLNKADSFDLSEEQKDWIKNHLAMFTKVIETLKDNDASNEYVASYAEDLYDNIKTIKKKVISWRKYKSIDYETFKMLRKEKSESWIPPVDVIPAPSRLSEIKDSDLWDINFPCMSYTNEELCQLSERIFKEQKVLSELNFSPEKLTKLVQKVCLEYNVPAYHNFSHGFNVFQMCYSIIKKTELQAALDKTEVFAALIASLGHDLDHRGYNNQYEIKLKTKNALAYFDNAVLENLHASILIRILKDPEIAFFDCLPDVNKKNQFRDLATSLILATDMTKHNKLLQKFTEGVKATLEYRKQKASGQPIDKNVEEKAFVMERTHDKKRILKNLVHACDIGNPCQKYENYIYWAALISHEFDYQSKKEEKRGVEVIGFLKYKDLPSFYGGQVFFTKNLVLPLWEQIALAFEGAKEAVDNIHDNLKRLEEDKIKATQG